VVCHASILTQWTLAYQVAVGSSRIVGDGNPKRFPGVLTTGDQHAFGKGAVKITKSGGAIMLAW